MKRIDENSTDTGERRRTRRLAARGHVKLTVETRELEGRADNISQTGVLFFSEGDLRVSVEIEDKGETRTLRGRLVRAQRMRGQSFGWAVEFDPA
jgi:hypothetical protein